MDQGIHFIMKKKGTVKQCKQASISAITLRGSTPCLRWSFVFPQSVLVRLVSCLSHCHVHYTLIGGLNV